MARESHTSVPYQSGCAYPLRYHLPITLRHHGRARGLSLPVCGLAASGRGSEPFRGLLDRLRAFWGLLRGLTWGLEGPDGAGLLGVRGGELDQDGVRPSPRFPLLV